MYRRVLIPLDGSRFAESALPLALAVARRTGATLHLVTVDEPLPSFSYEAWEGAARDWSRQYLANLVERAQPLAGGEVSATLLSGQVAVALEQEAEALDVDLVVMATHGRGALTRAWLGSVTDAFLGHTTRPVLLVRPDDSDAEVDLASEPDLSRVLVPLDGTNCSESILANALDFAALFDATVRLTRVVAYPVQLASAYLPAPVQVDPRFVPEATKSAMAYLDAHSVRIRERGLEVETSVVVAAQAGQGVLDEIEDGACGLVAMGTHARSGITRAILGSTTDKVVRGTHVPVLLHRSTGD